MARFHPSAAAAAVLAALAAAPAAAQETRAWTQTDPRQGLLTPLEGDGGLPPIALMQAPTEAELAFRAASARHAAAIRRIRHRHFDGIRDPDLRAEGIAKLTRLTDPAAFAPLIEELAGEADDVRLAVLDHLAGRGEAGQAALAAAAVYQDDARFRHEAARRLTEPAAPRVLAVLELGLRSADDDVANQAAAVAGALRAVETIPLLILAQAAPRGSGGDGDLAWIAIQKQRAFVAGLVPLTGDQVGAFQPIPGVVTDGVILRVVDAVVVIYRTEVHRTLVAMTTQDWGRSTAHLGYDLEAWTAWYNDEYLPYKQARLREAQLAAELKRARKAQR